MLSSEFPPPRECGRTLSKLVVGTFVGFACFPLVSSHDLTLCPGQDMPCRLCQGTSLREDDTVQQSRSAESSGFS
jgi:hypothetical protein